LVRMAARRVHRRRIRTLQTRTVVRNSSDPRASARQGPLCWRAHRRLARLHGRRHRDRRGSRREFVEVGRKQKAEGRKKKAESRKQKAESRKHLTLPSAFCLLPTAH